MGERCRLWTPEGEARGSLGPACCASPSQSRLRSGRRDALRGSRRGWGLLGQAVRLRDGHARTRGPRGSVSEGIKATPRFPPQTHSTLVIGNIVLAPQCPNPEPSTGPGPLPPAAFLLGRKLCWSSAPLAAKSSLPPSQAVPSCFGRLPGLPLPAPPYTVGSQPRTCALRTPRGSSPDGASQGSRVGPRTQVLLKTLLARPARVDSKRSVWSTIPPPTCRVRVPSVGSGMCPASSPGGLGTAQEARTRARAHVAYGGKDHLIFVTVCPSCRRSCSLGGEFQEPSGPLMPIRPHLHRAPHSRTDTQPSGDPVWECPTASCCPSCSERELHTPALWSPAARLTGHPRGSICHCSPRATVFQGRARD